jgi:hypothetical protein
VVARLFKLAIVSLEKGQNFEEEFFQKNSSVGPHMVNLLAYCAKMFEKLVKIQEKNKELDDDDLYENQDKVNRLEGHLVEMNCGHRGTPHRQEEKRISRLMRRSGFIPMLEDMPRDKVKIIVQ